VIDGIGFQQEFKAVASSFRKHVAVAESQDERHRRLSLPNDPGHLQPAQSGDDHVGKYEVEVLGGRAESLMCPPCIDGPSGMGP
jgi:hypothetical protein